MRAKSIPFSIMDAYCVSFLVFILTFIVITGMSLVAHAASPGDMITVAGDGVAAYAGDGGPATSASINLPHGVTKDSAGNLYIADRNNNRIRRVDAVSGAITTVAGNGVQSFFAGDGGPATSASLAFPLGIVLDDSGNMFIADQSHQRIRRVDAVSGIITTVAGSGFFGYSGDGGAATAARFSDPVAVTLDAAGNLYIADFNNHRIRKVDAATGIISTVAGNGFPTFAGDGGPAAAASLNTPGGVVFDTAGNMYIPDMSNNRIRKVDATTGIITTLAGTGSATFDGDGGPAASASFNGPVALTLDSSDNLYISDLSNHRIRKIDAASGIISTVAGNGIPAFAGDGGPAASASINGPRGIFVDAAGNLYIADFSNSRIREVIKATPTAAAISYTPAGPYQAGNQVTITATFNDLLVDAPAPQIALSGANTLAAADMTKVDSRHYTYIHTVTAGSGSVTVSIPTGTDINGIPVSPTPASGASFTVISPPSATTGLASAITSAGATLNGTVNDNSDNTTVSFDYGLTTVYSNSVSAGTLNAGSGSTAVSAAVTGLSCSSTYHFRVVAANSAGTASGLDATFSTDACPVSVIAVQTSPAGLRFFVDGSPSVTTLATNWLIDSLHNLATVSPQTLAGVQYVFANWSDGGDLSHNVSTPATATTYTANFTPLPPTISGAPATSVVAGAAYGFTPTASNATGFSIANMPVWMSFDTTTGTLSGTPSAADAGTYSNITITALDGTASSSLPPFSIAVVFPSSGSTYQFEWMVPNLGTPYSVAVDGNGFIFISGNLAQIKKLDSSGALISTLGSTTGSGPGQFNSPREVAFDGSGNIFVADSGNNRIQKLDSNGLPLAAWGSFGFGPGQFFGLYGIAVDGSGNMYVTESNNSRVQKLDPNGVPLAAWGGFQFPSGMVLDGNGNFYVADTSNHIIRKFSPDGTALATWGSFGSAPGQFNGPNGVAVDGSGNVYVADTWNHRIQKLDPTGAPVALWGSNGGGSGQFNYPTGVAVDGSGTVYVTETSGNRIQKFNLMHTLSVSAAGSGTGAVSTSSGGLSFTYPTAATGSGLVKNATPVTLTATAGVNSTASWQGPCDTINGDGTALATCTVAHMTADASFTANFAVAPLQPTISGTPVTSVTAGAAYNFTPTASNAAGFSIANLPSWMSFNSTTGVLSGTPGAANIGTYNNIIISALNGPLSASLPPFSITVTAAVSTVTIQTAPAGRSFRVDGVAYSSARTFTWTPGSVHTIATTSPQGTGGTRYVFNNWSDGGAMSHSVTAAAGTATFTANFDTQYRLTTSVSPTGSGSVSPATGSFFAAGSLVNLQATPVAPYTFGSWTGPVASTSSAATTVAMTAPVTVRANMLRPPLLTASIASKSGTMAARIWRINLSNGSGRSTANAAQIDGLTLTQTAGSACSPVITTPAAFPLLVGDISSGSTASANVTINFTGCANTSRFTVVIPSSSDGGAYSWSRTLTNQAR